MALQLNKTFKNGVIAPESYIKIGWIEFVPNRTVGLYCYFNAISRHSNPELSVEIARLPIEGMFSLEEIYTYLKTLPEFDGAIDV